MVLGPNISTSQEQPQQPSLQRQALKRRRGLSQFYANKSQSFSCIQDLVNNPFSRSCTSLAKRSSSWRQQLARCASVDEAGEDVMSDCDTTPVPDILPCLHQPSWHHPTNSSGVRDGGNLVCQHSALEHQHQHQRLCGCQQQASPTVRAAEHPLLQEAPKQQLLSGPSNYWCDNSTTDSLCRALQTASIANPFPCYGMSHTRGLVPTSLVIIEADAAH